MHDLVISSKGVGTYGEEEKDSAELSKILARTLKTVVNYSPGHGGLLQRSPSLDLSSPIDWRGLDLPSLETAWLAAKRP